jgi:hypothetical protein
VLVSSLPSVASRFERERGTAFGSFIARLAVACLLLAHTLLAATGEHGVVAAEHELASEAGVEMFRQGGNAVDAAVAAQFATGVVNPSSCGIGGGGFALVYDAKKHDLHFIDFRETAPAAAKPDMYVRDGKVNSMLSLRGALAVAVPGEVRGLAEVLRRYGTLPLAKVLEPAIRYASEGFPVGSHLAVEIRANVEEIRRHPALAAIYLTEKGDPYGAGDKLRGRARGRDRGLDRGERRHPHGPRHPRVSDTRARATHRTLPRAHRRRRPAAELGRRDRARAFERARRIRSPRRRSDHDRDSGTDGAGGARSVLRPRALQR